jgi:hypothetical protein
MAKRNRHGNPPTGLPHREAVKHWWDTRTPEQREAMCQKKRDAAVMQMWIPKGPRPGAYVNRGGRKKMDPNTPCGGTTLVKIEKASVKRIIKDLVGVRPELIENAIIDGLMAPPPRSFPYVALAAAYLDGKPVDGEPMSPEQADLSKLSREQLMARALRIAAGLEQKPKLAIIDVTPEREPSLAELQSQIEQAQEEVRLAEAEVRRLKGGSHD